MKSLITSSADPQKISLTIKGLLTTLIPVILVVTGMAEADITQAIDSIGTLVFAVASAIAAGQVLFGLGRKIYLKRWS